MTTEYEEEDRFAWEAGDRRIQAREDAWLRRQQEKEEER